MRAIPNWIQYVVSYTLLIFSLSAEETLPEWKKVLQALSQEEKACLESYFETMLLNSEGGYVLFGSKPVCEEGILAPEKCRLCWVGMRNHRRSVDLFEGIKFGKAILETYTPIS